MVAPGDSSRSETLDRYFIFEPKNSYKINRGRGLSTGAFLEQLDSSDADLLPFKEPIFLGDDREKIIDPKIIKSEAVAWKIFKEVSVFVKFEGMELMARTKKLFESGFFFNGGNIVDKEFVERLAFKSVDRPRGEERNLFDLMKEKGTSLIIRTRAGTFHPFCKNDKIV